MTLGIGASACQLGRGEDTIQPIVVPCCFLQKNNVLIFTVFFYFVWFAEAFFTLSKLGTEGNLAVGGEGCLQQIVSLS